MMRYLIQETLVEAGSNGLAKSEAGQEGAPVSAPTGEAPFVAVLTPEEWAAQEGSFDMGIDFEPDASAALDVQAEVNFDSITGAITVPDRSDFTAAPVRFAFALDEKGMVLIDAGRTAGAMIESLARTKRWREPGLERFLHDFLTLLVRDDPTYLTSVERELDQMEAAIYADEGSDVMVERVNEIRGSLRDLDDYLEHLQDFAAVLEDNENGFFHKKNLRYFRMFINRVEKLRDKVQSLREQAIQLRDLYKMHLDIRQNRIMTVLTVVTAIFAPLTLVAGWYGMNFVHMPELDWPWAYPVVFVACVFIVVGMVVFFKRKKWL